MSNSKNNNEEFAEKVSAYYDAFKGIPPQSESPVYRSAYDECNGNFDARIGLEPKSDSPDYLRGYQNGN